LSEGLLHLKIQEGYMPFHEYKTYYRIVGEPNPDKAPLLLIHGGPGSSHNYFDSLMTMPILAAS
jgi:proline iminopeptidase